MNLGGWRFVLFALVGSAAIVLLASIGVPGEDQAPVHSQTGERGVLVRTVAEALMEARLSGNAREALEHVRRRLLEFSGDRRLRRVEAILTTELTPEASDLHPAAAAIRAEQALALRARARGENSTRARARATG